MTVLLATSSIRNQITPQQRDGVDARTPHSSGNWGQTPVVTQGHFSFTAQREIWT